VSELKELKSETYDLIIAVTSSDETNVVIFHDFGRISIVFTEVS